MGIICYLALLELVLVIIFGRTSSSRIESLNALLRRMLSLAQTYVPEFKDLSAKFMLSRLRLRARSIANPPGLKQRRRRKKAVQRSKGKKRSGGGGGAWRAFVRQRMKGQAKQLFTSLSAEYAALTDEERKALEELGKVATTTHATGNLAFGLTSRSMARLNRRNAANVVRPPPPQIVEYDDENVLRTLAAHLERVKADVAIAKSISCEKARRDVYDFADWSNSDGVRLRDTLVSVIPAVGRFAPDMHCLAAGVGMKVTTWCSSVGNDLPRVVALMEKPEHAELREALLEWFEESHKLVSHEDQPEIPSPPQRRNQKPTCKEAGICLCDVPGDIIHRFSLRLVARLKRLVAAQTDLQASGSLVIRLNGMSLDGAVVEGLHLSFLYTL